MRKLLVWFVLLLHVNTYMFFPMIDEEDVYEINGKQRDDINTLVEFINQILLGNRDSTPDDEDDDQAHYYQVKHSANYTVNNMVCIPVITAAEPSAARPEYAFSITHRLLSATYDITSPPPEA